MRLFLRVLLAGVLLAGLAAGGIYLYAQHYYTQPSEVAEAKTVLIEKGTGFSGIVDILAQNGVIAQPLLYKGMVLFTRQQAAFKAGEYAFPPGISPREVTEKMVRGDVVIHSLTVAEGLTLNEVLALVAQEPLLEGEVQDILAEGELLPETYFFTRGETRAALVGRMRRAMQETLEKLWAARQDNLPLTTPQEALTLASIVEKETGVAEERGRVAAVFINRLRLGMKLQSDPTTLYGLILHTGKRPERLLKRDLEAPTAYNTYVIDGLPPGPIANPGKAALQAALNPPHTDELYFVADGSGGHRFASTLLEHNENVRHYRQLKR